VAQTVLCLLVVLLHLVCLWCQGRRKGALVPVAPDIHAEWNRSAGVPLMVAKASKYMTSYRSWVHHCMRSGDVQRVGAVHI
jgi:hypothetical protein